MSSNDQTSGTSLYIRALICNAASGAAAGNLPSCFLFGFDPFSISGSVLTGIFQFRNF